METKSIEKLAEEKAQRYLLENKIDNILIVNNPDPKKWKYLSHIIAGYTAAKEDKARMKWVSAKDFEEAITKEGGIHDGAKYGGNASHNISKAAKYCYDLVKGRLRSNGKIQSAIHGFLDGIELDNTADVIGKSHVVDMLKDLLKLANEAKTSPCPSDHADGKIDGDCIAVGFAEWIDVTCSKYDKAQELLEPYQHNYLGKIYSTEDLFQIFIKDRPEYNSLPVGDQWTRAKLLDLIEFTRNAGAGYGITRILQQFKEKYMESEPDHDTPVELSKTILPHFTIYQDNEKIGVIFNKETADKVTEFLNKQITDQPLPDGGKGIDLDAALEIRKRVMHYNDTELQFKAWFKSRHEFKQGRFTVQDMRKCATQFFYHWWNTPGQNTEEGFDAWFPNYLQSLTENPGGEK